MLRISWHITRLLLRCFHISFWIFPLTTFCIIYCLLFIDVKEANSKNSQISRCVINSCGKILIFKKKSSFSRKNFQFRCGSSALEKTCPITFPRAINFQYSITFPCPITSCPKTFPCPITFLCPLNFEEMTARRVLETYESKKFELVDD